MLYDNRDVQFRTAQSDFCNMFKKRLWNLTELAFDYFSDLSGLRMMFQEIVWKAFTKVADCKTESCVVIATSSRRSPHSV